MPLTNDHDAAVTWSASSTLTMSNNTTRYVSDAIPIHATAVLASLQVKADNSNATPQSGDVAELWIAWSPDGVNFDSEEHAMELGQLDTVGANDPGEDPATRTYTIEVLGKQALKLISRGPQSASRNIALSAIYNESRSS